MTHELYHAIIMGICLRRSFLYKQVWRLLSCLWRPRLTNILLQIADLQLKLWNKLFCKCSAVTKLNNVAFGLRTYFSKEVILKQLVKYFSWPVLYFFTILRTENCVIIQTRLGADYIVPNHLCLYEFIIIFQQTSVFRTIDLQQHAHPNELGA